MDCFFLNLIRFGDYTKYFRRVKGMNVAYLNFHLFFSAKFDALAIATKRNIFYELSQTDFILAIFHCQDTTTVAFYFSFYAFFVYFITCITCVD